MPLTGRVLPGALLTETPRNLVLRLPASLTQRTAKRRRKSAELPTDNLAQNIKSENFPISDNIAIPNITEKLWEGSLACNYLEYFSNYN